MLSAMVCGLLPVILIRVLGARFSPAFLVLKARSIGVDVAFVPIVLIFMHLVYAAAAYPFGILADHIDRRRQLVIGAVVLVAADLILANATEAWMAVVGAGFGDCRWP